MPGTTCYRVTPYCQGAALRIRSHTPPQPYGADYEEAIRRPVQGLVDRFGQPKVDHLSFVLSNPPLDTDTPSNPKSHVLTIIEAINHNPKEDGGGPYLVRCHLDSNQSRHYVAKIYDAFEYKPAEDGDDDSYDCVYIAKKNYSREAAAYENIPSC
ncbi:hypothetical protein VTI74DRAFT_9559 [Chaetomium olivicolor]